jgi:hypothetical protein
MSWAFPIKSIASAVSPKAATPAPPPVPPPPPTLASTSTVSDVAVQEQQQKLQRGRTSTILTGGSGLSDTGTTSKTLLG